MDIISLNEAATANGRIEIMNANPDSTSGIVTVPKTIASGETVTVPAGRVAVLPNVQVDGTIEVEAGGEIFIPAGANFGDLEEQIFTKADTSYVNSKYVGFKNYIINGGFDVWQRGTSYDPNISRYGAADRWWGYASSTGVLISQQTINTNGKYDLKIATNSSSNVDIRQGIECVTGKQLSKASQYTLSFVARFPVGTNVLVSIGYADNMSFANGKFLTAPDQIIGIGTGSYETYTVTVDNVVPNSTNTMMVVRIGGGSVSSSHYISNVQLEEGSVATPFEQRPYGLELSLCQERAIDLYGVSYRANIATVNSLQFRLPIQLSPLGGVSSLLSGVGDGTDWGIVNIGGTIVTGFTLSLVSVTNGYAQIAASKTSHGLSDGYITFFTPNKNILSKEI